MRNRLHVVRWLMLSASIPFAPACDQFMILRGTVGDCATHEPLAGTTVEGHDDAGLSKGQDLGSIMTKDDGTFEFDTSVNAGDSVTLTFTKAGYSPLQHHVDGMPDAPLALCLTPAA